jgi:hypothetical protein
MKHSDAENYAQAVEDLPLFRAARVMAGPFADSPERPRPEEVLVAGLIWPHKGRTDPISIARLHELTKLSERDIKDVVEQLVITHHMKIGARRHEPFGYFFIEDAEDLAVAIGPYKAQVMAMLRRLKVLDSAHGRCEFAGQIRLLLEGN